MKKLVTAAALALAVLGLTAGPATGPSSTAPLLMLAGGLLAAGVALVLARRTRKH